MATQKGRNWSSGDIVTAANLSLVERGVSAMAEEYTPTTWSNGDTVTATALNNIEQGIVSGGGSSDMYTAEVSVIASNGYSFYPLNFESSKIIGVANDENNGLTDYMSKEGVPFIFSSGNEDFTWYILNNESIYLISQGSIFSVSGSAEVIDTDEIEFVRIYGDCTITISQNDVTPK